MNNAKFSGCDFRRAQLPSTKALSLADRDWCNTVLDYQDLKGWDAIGFSLRSTSLVGTGEMAV